jgi:hypothetical protein
MRSINVVVLRTEANSHAAQSFPSPERSVYCRRRVPVSIVENDPGHAPSRSVAVTRIAEHCVEIAVSARRAAQRTSQSHDLWFHRRTDSAACAPLAECRGAIFEFC